MMSLDNRKYYQDFFVLSRIRELKFRKFFPTRPEGAEALSPGRALKKVPNFKCRAYF